VDRILRISQLVYMIATTFQRLHPCFRAQATRKDYWKYCPMPAYVIHQRWRPLTGSKQEMAAERMAWGGNFAPFNIWGLNYRERCKTTDKVWFVREANLNLKVKTCKYGYVTGHIGVVISWCKINVASPGRAHKTELFMLLTLII